MSLGVTDNMASDHTAYIYIWSNTLEQCPSCYLDFFHFHSVQKESQNPLVLNSHVMSFRYFLVFLSIGLVCFVLVSLSVFCLFVCLFFWLQFVFVFFFFFFSASICLKLLCCKLWSRLEKSFSKHCILLSDHWIIKNFIGPVTVPCGTLYYFSRV